MQKLILAAIFTIVAFVVSCTPPNNNTPPIEDSIITDDYEKGSPGITITTSTVLVPEYMAAAGTNEMFPKDDPNSLAFLSNINTGNFTSYTGSVEGANVQWFRWAVPFGTKGSGMNVGAGAPCDIMQGGLCKTGLKDFNIAWLDLLKNTNTKPVYAANIARGTLEELYYVIETLDNLKVIMYGQELASADKKYANLSSTQYPVKFYSWVDSVKKHFPSRTFYHCADLPDISSRETVWESDFFAYKKLPIGTCIKQYSHGFHQYTLTGKVINDSAIYSAAIKTALPLQIKNIDSLFSKGGVYISQFSTGVPPYGVGQNGNTVAVQNNFLATAYYLRAEKTFVEAHRDGKWNLIGVSVIGLKLLMPKLDFKVLGILNRAWGEGRYATTVTHTMGSQVHVLPTSLNGVYYVAILNLSGKEVGFPKNWNLDGKTVQPLYSKADGYSCTDLGSTTGVQYNPLTNNKIPPFGIIFMEAKAPSN